MQKNARDGKSFYLNFEKDTNLILCIFALDIIKPLLFISLQKTALYDIEFQQWVISRSVGGTLEVLGIAFLLNATPWQGKPQQANKSMPLYNVFFCFM